MRTDVEVRVKGVETLIQVMGEVDAERFISLMIHEPLDYTQWQRGMLQDKSIKEISAMAMDLRKAMSK